MQSYIDQAKNQFENLDSREKLLVAGGGLAFVVLLFLFLALIPAYQKANTLHEDIQFNQEDVQWMQDASSKLKSNGTSSSFSGINRSLLALLDEQFKSAGLASTVKSIQPDGKNKAKVRFDNCAFDNLITLVGKLESENNVIVLRTNIKKSADSGRVAGSITFSRG